MKEEARRMVEHRRSSGQAMAKKKRPRQPSRRNADVVEDRLGSRRVGLVMAAEVVWQEGPGGLAKSTGGLNS